MPPYSTLKTFVTSLKTGRTNITESLDRLMTNPGRHLTHAHFADLQVENAFNAPLPGWARTALRSSGMTEPEIDHIDVWPDVQKEAVRQKMVAAIESDRPIRFRWELYGGDAPVNEAGEDQETGATVIVFRSPGNGVKLSPLNIGLIRVQA